MLRARWGSEGRLFYGKGGKGILHLKGILHMRSSWVGALDGIMMGMRGGVDLLGDGEW